MKEKKMIEDKTCFDAAPNCLGMSCIFSGIIHRRDNKIEKNRKITAFKTALQECKDMAIDIARNGTAGYKTLDDLLNED